VDRDYIKAKVDESLSTSLLAKHLHKTKSSLAHIKMVHVIKDDSVSNVRWNVFQKMDLLGWLWLLIVNKIVRKRKTNIFKNFHARSPSRIGSRRARGLNWLVGCKQLRHMRKRVVEL